MPAAVTNPFTPRKAAGSYWNTTIEAPDRLLQGPGNALAGASPAAAAVTAATNAAAGTGTGNAAAVTTPYNPQGRVLPGYERTGTNAYQLNYDPNNPQPTIDWFAQQRANYLAGHPGGSAPSNQSVAYALFQDSLHGRPLNPTLLAQVPNWQDYINSFSTSWGGQPTFNMRMGG